MLTTSDAGRRLLTGCLEHGYLACGFHSSTVRAVREVGVDFSSYKLQITNPMSRYSFLNDTYETEIMKTLTIWEQFPVSSMDFRPAPKARTVLEQFDHQIQSEGKWMPAMLGIDVGDINPAQKTKEGYIEKYGADAHRRLAMLREKDDGWWEGATMFFDVERSRAWVMTRRMTHSAHHRGMLVIYLRLLAMRVPSVYGPTADTDGKVIYSFSE